MADDIVTRLREIPATIQTLGAEWVNELDAAVLSLEAADEIERLRAELDEERKYSRRLARELDMEDFGESEITDA